MKNNRVTVPQKVVDLLFSDDNFFNEVTSSRKIVIQKYPKSDQWVDSEGLHINFALAGYGRDDVRVSVQDSTLTVENVSKLEEPNSMQKGLIVRGIAKRSFTEKIFVHQSFNSLETKAEMENGLLKIVVPYAEEKEAVIVSVN